MAFLLENLATAGLTVFALALSIIAFRAWRHTRSRKVLLLASGFLLFAIKGVALTLGLFFVSPWDALLLPSLLFDLGILAVFYLAVLN
ncbi:MAG: hypothetical protein R3185_00155 [Candidatus Thermoplasmatota archaeon]|nr:hypothetical protein [Candidatus Thermoplasmatota archaeon]